MNKNNKTQGLPTAEINKMKLEELRAKWEKGLMPVCEYTFNCGSTLLVVLETEIGYHDKFYCHRYTSQINLDDQSGHTDWQVSVDKNGVDAVEVFHWISEKFQSSSGPVGMSFPQ